MARHRLVRRSVLRSGAAFLAGLVVFPHRALADVIRRRFPWVPSTADRPEQVDNRPGYLFFDSPEAAFIEAAVARLIPHDAVGPGALEAGVPRFIDRQLTGPYGTGDHFYLESPFPKGTPTQGWQMGSPAVVYRAAIAEVNRWTADTSGRAFAALDASGQDDVLKALEDGDAPLGGGVDAKAFFTLLLQNTIEGYFADPIYGGNRDMAAWRMIGFPGARYDHRPFVTRHGESYPLPPVGLMGRPEWRR